MDSNLSCCVGADVHPGLSSIEPEDACGALGVVRQHNRDGTIKSHGVVELVLEHIQIIEPVRISITETHTFTRDPPLVTLQQLRGCTTPWERGSLHMDSLLTPTLLFSVAGCLHVQGFHTRAPPPATRSLNSQQMDLKCTNHQSADIDREVKKKTRGERKT